MPEQMRKKIDYTIACIGEFARRWKLSPQAAFLYLDRHKGIEFLTDHYEIERTLSMEDAVDDLEMVCRNEIFGRKPCGAAEENREFMMDKHDLLIEYISQDVVAFLVESENLTIADALRLYYTSKTYEKLLDRETGLYRESSSYVYDLLADERRLGGFVQNEI